MKINIEYLKSPRNMCGARAHHKDGKQSGLPIDHRIVDADVNGMCSFEEKPLTWGIDGNMQMHIKKY